MSEETPKPPATRTRAAKPRAGIQRKTREEREQFARQEAERQQARNAEASKNASRGGTRGARGARGGRGGAAGLGDTRSRDTPGLGGGVFGAGGGLRTSLRSRALPEGYSEMLGEGQSSKNALMQTLEGEEAKYSSGGAGGGGGGGGASGSRSMMTATRHLDNVDMATDDERDGPKRDIERIALTSDEEEDDEDEDEDEDAIVVGRRKEKAVRRTPRGGNGLRPVRAPRERREEENTSAARKKSNRALKKSDAEIHETEADDDNAMDVDEQSPTVIKEQPPSSPETRRRNLKKMSAKARDTRIATETIEERAERLRVTEDTYKLRDIFVGQQSHQHSVIADKEDEEKEKIEETEADEAMLENGKLFLFQLPPLTPFLYDPSTDPPAEPEVKQEPGVGENISAVPTTTASQRKQPDTAPSKPGIKNEATSGTDPTTKPRPTLQLDGLLTASEPTRLPSGLVGKLRVHKSGKVSLDWGGTDMEVRYGTEVNFLQDAVLLETKKPQQQQQKNGGTGTGTGGEATASTATGENADGGIKKDDDEEEGLDLRSGKTYALGQVRRKMVLIPDWTKLYD